MNFGGAEILYFNLEKNHYPGTPIYKDCTYLIGIYLGFDHFIQMHVGISLNQLFWDWLNKLTV